ncbi:MAG: pyridoxine 5'-phosphate synthase [Spirochaetota bacterium]
MPAVLGVNLDHIATLRQVRGAKYPQPLDGARICEECGVHGVTLHLREDRRHIQDYDLFEIKKILTHCTLNLEMALSDDVIEVARRVQPYMTTIVPEKRQELTTEGGLDVRKYAERITAVTADFSKRGILVSLFIEPDREAVRISHQTGAEYIEIHTGRYADAEDEALRNAELQRIFDAAAYAQSLGLKVNAGHGLNYDNVLPILAMPALLELNIGHSIISRAVFTGLKEAVLEMKRLCESDGGVC